MRFCKLLFSLQTQWFAGSQGLPFVVPIIMFTIYFQIFQPREELNLQSFCPDGESTEQGSSANMNTQKEAHKSERNIISVKYKTIISVVCISFNSWDSENQHIACQKWVLLVKIIACLLAGWISKMSLLWWNKRCSAMWTGWPYSGNNTHLAWTGCKNPGRPVSFTLEAWFWVWPLL